MGNRCNIRIEGRRIKHTMGPVSLKLYDKFGLILRIETTVNDLTFFKHSREVEHRDGTKETKWASMQKTIYSLPALREILAAANRRYREFLSAIEDPRNGRDKLDKLSQPVPNEGRAASSTSAACRTGPCGDTSPRRAAGRCPDCSSASAFTDSSRRPATPTSTT